MTYRQLLEEINKLSPTQLDMKVITYVDMEDDRCVNGGTYIPAACLGIAADDDSMAGCFGTDHPVDQPVIAIRYGDPISMPAACS
jgi:hypothetical protein